MKSKKNRSVSPGLYFNGSSHPHIKVTNLDACVIHMLMLVGMFIKLCSVDTGTYLKFV
jgi:hypothetical protein